MSRDAKLKLLIIALVIAADAVLLPSMGLTFNLKSLLWPLGFIVLLCGFGIYYQRRGVENFVMCITALLQLIFFSAGYTILMYGAAAFDQPLIDEQLVAWDGWFGVHLPSIVAWAKRHPFIDGLLRWAYGTIMVQTALLVAILGFLGDRRPLELFLSRFFVGALLAVVIFFFYPAAGPFEAFDYPPDDAQQRYLNQLHSLRSGELRTVSITETEGLITFPSFHTAWAILIALAFRHRLGLFIVASILNAAIVASTLTTGWHYWVDVLGGVAICAVAVVACDALYRLISTPDTISSDPLPVEEPIC